MARNSTEQFGGDYDLGSRESAFFLYSSRRRQHINSEGLGAFRFFFKLYKHLRMGYYAGFKG